MEILEIKNYGPIADAQLDLKSFVVLIGPQSSGKSAIAKVISILRNLVFEEDASLFSKIHKRMGIDSFLRKSTFIKYESENYRFTFKAGKGDFLFKNSKIDDYKLTFESSMKDHKKIVDNFNLKKKDVDNLQKVIKDLLKIEKENSEPQRLKLVEKHIKEIENLVKELSELGDQSNETHKASQTYINYSKSAIYIPSERNIFSILSSTTFSFLVNDIPIPESIKSFGSILERAQNSITDFDIDFLDLSYHLIEKKIVILDKKTAKQYPLANMSSGVQSIIPLLLVLELFATHDNNQTLIVEEPELNLFPEAQYSLIQHIVKKANINKHSKNDIVITTHSPYVLSGINNLVMASATANNEKKLKKVNAIISRECWIDDNDFSAYYLEDGKIRNIIDESSGLIDNNELDETSLTINNDFNLIFDLFAS